MTSRYAVTVAWGEEQVTVVVMADDPDDAYAADIGSELPEDWPEDGWDIVEVELAD